MSTAHKLEAAVALHEGVPAPALLDELCAIEAACFERPWGVEELGESLAQPGISLAIASSATETTPAAVRAYCLFQRVLDEVEILQVATHPAAQRQGLGRSLIAHVLRAAHRTGCVAVFLEVRRSNVAAVALYQGAGFAVCGVRRGYYPAAANAANDAAEDALLLRCDLPLPDKSR